MDLKFVISVSKGKRKMFALVKILPEAGYIIKLHAEAFHDGVESTKSNNDLDNNYTTTGERIYEKIYDQFTTSIGMV